MEIRFEVIAHDDALANSGFILPWIAERKDFDKYTCFAAIVDERLAGLLIADPKVYEPEILSIGVSGEYQGLGIATALLGFAVSEILKNYDEYEADTGNRIIAHVYGEPEKIAAVKRVFEKCTFDLYDEGSFYEATVDMLRNNANVQNPSVIKALESDKGKAAFKSLKDTDINMIRTFGNYLAQNEIFPGIVHDDLDEDLSMFGIDDGEIKCCFLFAKESDGVIQNMLLYNREQDSLSSRNLLYLLTASSCAAIRKFPVDTRISFWTGNLSTKGLVKKIFPDAVQKETHIRFEIPFSEIFADPDNRFTDDIAFSPVENETMVCAGCKHCTGAVLSCGKYLEKPSGVLDGGGCKFFSEK